MVISAMSLSEVSEMAMVPDSECRIPTLMVSAACRVNVNRPLSIRALAARVVLIRGRRFIVWLLGCPCAHVGSKHRDARSKRSEERRIGTEYVRTDRSCWLSDHSKLIRLPYFVSIFHSRILLI